jgi:hypothetical protein
MVSDRSRDLLFPITILISVAVGAVIGGSVARSGAEDRGPLHAANADSKALVDAIDAMRAELARTRKQFAMASSSTPPSGLAESRSAAPDWSAELRKATGQLAEAADLLRSASARATGASAPMVVPRAVDPAVWTDMDQHSWAENTKPYLLWNKQQVLDRFGLPDQVGADGFGPYWWYNRDQQRHITFRFIDGLVSALDG